MTNIERYQVANDTTFVLGFHLLSGFATELYFKAYLFSTGHTDRELRSAALRHDLKKLLELAETDGFNNQGATALANLLGDQHKSHEFRYMATGSNYTLRPLNLIFDDFSALDVAVDVATGASVSYGRSPGGNWVIPADKSNWRFPI